MTKTASTRGRPRRPVALHVYRVHLDQPLVDAITQLRPVPPADQKPMPVSRWCTLAISQARGYSANYLPHDVVSAVRTIPETEDLQEFAAQMRPSHVWPVEAGAHMFTIRLDKPLADKINQLCMQRGLSYAEYLREVLRYATGLHRGENTSLDLQEKAAV